MNDKTPVGGELGSMVKRETERNPFKLSPNADVSRHSTPTSSTFSVAQLAMTLTKVARKRKAFCKNGTRLLHQSENSDHLKIYWTLWEIKKNIFSRS